MYYTLQGRYWDEGRGTSRETSAVEFESIIGQKLRSKLPQSTYIIYKIFNIMRYMIHYSVQTFTCCNMNLCPSSCTASTSMCKQTTCEETTIPIAHVMTINPSRHYDNTPRPITTFFNSIGQRQCRTIACAESPGLRSLFLHPPARAPTTPRTVFGHHPTSSSHQSTAFHMPRTSAPLTRM